MPAVIVNENDLSKFDEAMKKPFSFVRFHHPRCHHCIQMQGEMDTLMKYEELIGNDDLSIVDAHTDISSKSEHDVCKKHDGAVPSMFFVILGKTPQEYSGPRKADEMKKYILSNMKVSKGGKKKKKKTKKKKMHKKRTHKRKSKRKGKKHKKRTHKRKHRARKKK